MFSLCTLEKYIPFKGDIVRKKLSYREKMLEFQILKEWTSCITICDVREGVKFSSIHCGNIFSAIDTRFKQGTLIYQVAIGLVREHLSTQGSRFTEIR